MNEKVLAPQPCPWHPIARLPEEWTAILKSIGERPYRAAQVFNWIHEQSQIDPAKMTNLSPALRERLFAGPMATIAQVAHCHKAADGTEKLVVRLHDGEQIETVLIPMGPQGSNEHVIDADLAVADDDDPDETDVAPGRRRVTQCVSTQVGCSMRCTFCASGARGLVRNLGAEEILAQVLVARQHLAEGQALTNVVLMGMGEPLNNYDQTARAIRLLTHPKGINLSTRRVTLSTVGLPAEISRLGRDFEGKVSLAVSLHAADDATRSRLVPIAKHHDLRALMTALRAYPLPPRRRITIEYVLIAGENDSPADAAKLAALLAGMRTKINLIPMNPVAHSPLRPSPPQNVEEFRRVLLARGFTCLLRQRRGDDISAACGQLATTANR